MNNILFKSYKKVYLQLYRFLLIGLKEKKITREDYNQKVKSISENYLKARDKLSESE